MRRHTPAVMTPIRTLTSALDLLLARRLDHKTILKIRSAIQTINILFQVQGDKKVMKVLKGEGTALEDIPNVAERFSRLTRNSPIVAQLHNLVFGGKAKVKARQPRELCFLRA